MANVKISDLTDGVEVEGGDLVEIERPGSPAVSRQVPLGTAAGADVGDFAAVSHSHSDATTGAAGFMSAADKTKLNGIASGATANTGTVTSVQASVPAGFSISGGPITGTGTLAITYAAGYQGYTSAEASKLSGIASGATANTGTVTSVAASVPTGLSVSGSPVTTSGTLAVTWASGYQAYTSAEASKLSGVASGATANTGTVTSVQVSVPTGLSVSGGPITTTGTLTITYAAGYVGFTSAQSTKLSGIETAADVTDAVNVAAAGALMAATADQTITGGARVTSLSLGTITTGTVTPDPGDRPMQHYTNNGVHTLAPGSNAGTYVLDITNGASAGAITASGWTKVAGDPFTTTNAEKFRCHCSVGQAGSLIVVQALQ